MSHYKIILDEPELDRFTEILPELESTEVYYLCLFGRHKYDPTFPNTRDSGQLERRVCRSKADLKDKIRRMECPVGSFSRDGAIATQGCLALYIAINPRSLVKANQALLVELAKRFALGQTDFNPVALANTEIHRAVGKKRFVDFDYDGVGITDLIANVGRILQSPDRYHLLQTRGGFHLLVDLSKAKDLGPRWYQDLAALPGCDVKGSDCLTPVPGCTQGGFCPRIWRNYEKQETN